MQIDIDDRKKALLDALAKENGTTAEGLLSKLIEQEHNKRHQVYVPGRNFIYVKCGLPDCFEIETRPGNWRD